MAHYNLRAKTRRPSGIPSAIGTHPTPTLTNADVPPSRESSDSVSAVGSHVAADDTSNNRISAAGVQPGLTFSQVVSRSPSPELSSQSSLTSASAAVNTPSNPNKNILRRISVGEAPVEDAVSTETAMDVDDRGSWTPVHHGRRRTKSLELANKIAVDREDVRIERAEVLTNNQRMVVQARNRARSHSVEEGSSKRKGKTVDPRNWGAVGIPNEEMDPEAQHRELESYSSGPNTRHFWPKTPSTQWRTKFLMNLST